MIDLRKPAPATQPAATGLTRCRLPLARTRADTAARYPNLLRAMQGVAILSPNEAQGALDSLILHGIDCAGEAVNHYGGCLAVVRQAWRFRANYRYQRPSLADIEIVENVLIVFRHLLPRTTTRITPRALAAEIRKVYDPENVHTACALNTLAAVSDFTLYLKA